MEKDDALTRVEISKRVSEETNIPIGTATDLLEQVIGLIRQELASGEEVNIVRFGRLRLRQKRARVGRNPRTGETAPITERKVVTFKASRLLRKRISGGRSQRDQGR